MRLHSLFPNGDISCLESTQASVFSEGACKEGCALGPLVVSFSRSVEGWWSDLGVWRESQCWRLPSPLPSLHLQDQPSFKLVPKPFPETKSVLCTLWGSQTFEHGYMSPQLDCELSESRTCAGHSSAPQQPSKGLCTQMQLALVGRVCVCACALQTRGKQGHG